jgi:hypothetical protein
MRTIPDDYTSRITWTKYHQNTTYRRLCRTIRRTRMDVRKEILKLLRVSDTPDRNTFLAQQLPILSSMHSDYSITTTPVEPTLDQQQFFDYIQRYFLNSDISTSLAVCYAKSMPFESPISEASFTRYQSASKELQASQVERSSTSKINYGVIFDNDIYSSWSSEVDPNPALAKYYNYMLREWKEVTHKAILGTSTKYVIENDKQATLP